MQRKPCQRNISLLFLVDENLPFSIAEYLKSHMHNVLDVADSAFRGSSDKTLWTKAAEEGRIIITRDLDFPIPGLKPFPYGVILLRVPYDFTARQIAEIFKKSFPEIELDKFKDKVAVISPGRIRISSLH